MEVSADLASEIRDQIQAIGPTLPDGRQLLTERVYKEIRDFRVEVFPNEGQHRGRPHCKVTTNLGAVSVDITTGEIIVGNAGHWTATVQRVVLANSKGIMASWDEMRPDDQKLPKKDAP